ncbi:MAG TPA: methyltransferase [Planctomycetota bacterium]|jgi:protein-S-isoprenylcysteine O-methyltransferase Ste14|nr:methyltransferase [Planctomycetota bacterium]
MIPATRKEALAAAAGAGLYGALALGYVNRAAHESGWGPRIMFGAFGLYAALGAFRMASFRKAASSEAPWPHRIVVLLGVLAPLAVRAEGRVLWDGGAWIAAAGALLGALSAVALGDCFGILPAVRGVVARGPYRRIRHPMTTALFLIAAGYLISRWSPWNAAALGAAALLGAAAAFLEERLLGREDSYRDYAARVPWRFVPGVL